MGRARGPHRITRAMGRISRDKYLPPAEVSRISGTLHLCIPRSVQTPPSSECFRVGMYRGEPIVRLNECGFNEVTEALKKSSATTPPELRALMALAKAREKRDKEYKVMWGRYIHHLRYIYDAKEPRALRLAYLKAAWVAHGEKVAKRMAARNAKVNYRKSFNDLREIHGD